MAPEAFHSPFQTKGLKEGEKKERKKKEKGIKEREDPLKEKGQT